MRVVYSPRYHLDFGAHVFPTAKYRLVASAGRARRTGARRVRRAGAGRPGTTWRWSTRRATSTPLRARHADRRRARAARDSLAAGDRRRLPADDRRHHRPPPASPSTAATASPCTSAAASTTPSPTTARASACSTTWPSRSACCCASGCAGRAAVVDLDVHHGNGTASIFAGDPRVFTLSMHQQANYPEVKPRGSLDIGLARRHGDDDYLAALDRRPGPGARAPAGPRVLPGRRRSLRRRSARRPRADARRACAGAIAWCSTAARVGWRARRRRCWPAATPGTRRTTPWRSTLATDRGSRVGRLRPALAERDARVRRSMALEQRPVRPRSSCR